MEGYGDYLADLSRIFEIGHEGMGGLHFLWLWKHQPWCMWCNLYLAWIIPNSLICWDDQNFCKTLKIGYPYPSSTEASCSHLFTQPKLCLPAWAQELEQSSVYANGSSAVIIQTSVFHGDWGVKIWLTPWTIMKGSTAYQQSVLIERFNGNWPHPAADFLTWGYHADHPVVRVFWRVVHATPEIWRRKLLLFCTGCDRVPILGLKALSLGKRGNSCDDGYDGYELAMTMRSCFEVMGWRLWGMLMVDFGVV